MRPNRNKLPLQANGTQSHRLACVKRLSLNIEMKKLHNILLAVLIASAGAVVGQEKTQQERIDALEQQLLDLQEQCDKPDFLNQAAAKGLTFNFYGSMKWKSTGGGGSDSTVDPHRWVLIPSYKLSDNALFVTELELEHGGVEDDDADARFDGYLELEQMYIDVQVSENITWRSFGISLIPVGTINQNHEPDQFYSVYRPRLYKYVIPSTWMEASTGIYGDLADVADGLSYNVLLSSGITSKYVTETSAAWDVRGTRPGVNETYSNSNIAYTLRLGYDKGGFSGSVSTYQTSYSNTSDAETDMGLYDVEVSYNFTEGSLKGLELIADYAMWDIETPTVLASGLAYDEITGHRLEAAYHIPRGDNELVPFIRHEKYDRKGSEKEYITYGAMYKFGDNWEIKLSYFDDQDSDSDEIQFGLGMQF